MLFSTVSTIFIVEGDSAAGSLTATRDVQTQAVFALKGKPLNTYGLTKKVIYENAALILPAILPRRRPQDDATKCQTDRAFHELVMAGDESHFASHQRHRGCVR